MTTMIGMRATTLGTESFITGSTGRTSVRTRKGFTVGPNTAPTITTADTRIGSTTKIIQVRATIIPGGAATEAWRTTSWPAERERSPSGPSGYDRSECKSQLHQRLWRAE